MADLFDHLISNQYKFWNKTTTKEQLETFSFSALCGMASYAGLHVLQNNMIFGAIPLLGLMTLPIRDASETTIKTTIVASFATVFYGINLYNRITPWQLVSVIALGSFIYKSTDLGSKKQ